LLFGAGGLTNTHAAATSTATLVPTDDGYVSSSQPTKSFGDATGLEVDARPVQRSYLKFDLSSIEGTVTRAALRLTATSPSTAGFSVRKVANSSWTEKALTYAHAPAFSKTTVAAAGAFASKQVLSLDVTASVKAGIRSFALVDRGSSAALSVASSENRTVSSRPRLVVTYTPTAPPGPCGRSTAPPKRVDHVVWIWMENKSYGDVIGSSAAPFENELAAECGLATNYHGVTHPSLPNYIAATSGDPQGITDDNAPASHPLGVASIYSQLAAIGKTWRDYEESAPGNCPLASIDRYAVKHDPAAYYTGIRSDCARWDAPLGTTSSGNFLTDLTNGTLPSFAFVTPNLCNDTHDCPVATGDAWLQSWFPKILASPNYAAGNTVVFLTWDEDDGSSSNHVPTIVVSPSTRAGTASATGFDHYALLETAEQLLGIKTFLGHAGDPGTTSMAAAFDLR
jgi:hypothetical protein